MLIFNIFAISFYLKNCIKKHSFFFFLNSIFNGWNLDFQDYKSCHYSNIFKCNTGSCKVSFNSQSKLDKHKKKHNSGYIYFCDCQKRYKIESNYNKHIKSCNNKLTPCQAKMIKSCNVVVFSSKIH